MEAAQMLQAGGRRLLSDCTMVGGMNKGGSIAVLLLLGFVVGAGVSWLFFWWRARRLVRIELEYRNRFGDAVKAGLPDVTAMVQAAHTPTISRGAPGGMAELPSACGGGPGLGKGGSAMAEGPLGMGVVSSMKHDPLRQAAGGAAVWERSNPAAFAASGTVRSSGGNPFCAEVPGFVVRKNEACSLNNTPSPGGGPAAAGSSRPSRSNSMDGRPPMDLIGTGVLGMAADPDSPRITKQGTAGAAAVPPSTAGADASPFTWPSLGTQPAADAPPQPAHVRSETVVVNPAGGAAGAAAAAAPGGGSDYQAAVGSAKAAQKQQLLHQVQGEEYGDEELDPEWASLLSDLDSRLQAAGRPRLSARERAVAIRSLIVATASQSAEAALSKAMHDVEAFRRAQLFKAAA